MPNREFTPSSGNVFTDLNLPQADDLLVKAELTSKIIAEIQQRSTGTGPPQSLKLCRRRRLRPQIHFVRCLHADADYENKLSEREDPGTRSVRPIDRQNGA